MKFGISKSSKQIMERFISANLLHGSIFMNHDFLMAQTAIIIVPHTVSMGTGIMNDDKICLLYTSDAADD